MRQNYKNRNEKQPFCVGERLFFCLKGIPLLD